MSIEHGFHDHIPDVTRPGDNMVGNLCPVGSLGEEQIIFVPATKVEIGKYAGVFSEQECVTYLTGAEIQLDRTQRI
jgi:hypothetical protein